MTIASDIVAAVGRKNLRDRLSVGDTAITNALTRGCFPARWYLVVKAECDSLGLECPESLFGFVSAHGVSQASTKSEDAA